MLRSFIMRGAGRTGVGTIWRAVNTDSTRFISTFARLAMASSHSMLSFAIYPPSGCLFELNQSSLHRLPNRRNDSAELSLGVRCLFILLLLESPATACTCDIRNQGRPVGIPLKNWLLYNCIRTNIHPANSQNKIGLMNLY